LTKLKHQNMIFAHLMLRLIQQEGKEAVGEHQPLV